MFSMSDKVIVAQSAMTQLRQRCWWHTEDECGNAVTHHSVQSRVLEEIAMQEYTARPRSSASKSSIIRIISLVGSDGYRNITAGERNYRYPRSCRLRKRAKRRQVSSARRWGTCENCKELPPIPEWLPVDRNRAASRTFHITAPVRLSGRAPWMQSTFFVWWHYRMIEIRRNFDELISHQFMNHPLPAKEEKKFRVHVH